MENNEYNHAEYENSIFNDDRYIKKDSFSNASLILALVAFMLSPAGISYVPGSLAIILGILCFRKNSPTPVKAKVSFVVSVISIIIGVGITVKSFSVNLDTMKKDPKFKEQVESLYKNTLGISFEDFWGVSLETNDKL